MKKVIFFSLVIFVCFFANYLTAQLVRTLETPDGKLIDEIRVPGGLKPEGYIPANIPLTRSDVVISGVPGFDWAYGCSATSAAMAMGYYDRNSYVNMYTGPTNGGVCPIPTSGVPVWTYTSYTAPPGTQPVTCYECPLSVTHNGFDGRTAKGHVDDYWAGYGATGPDPWVGNWAEHTQGDCTGDYMQTSQWITGSANTDGGTTFYYSTIGAPTYAEDLAAYPLSGINGLKKFIEAQSYSVYHNGSKYQIYNQKIIEEGLAQGFTFTQYQAEIDAGRPVMIHVEGHTMLGTGYNASTNEVLLHDTWGFHRSGGGYTPGRMTWAGSYSTMHHYGVSVIQLASTSGPPGIPSTPAPTNGASGVSIDTDLSWINGVSQIMLMFILVLIKL